MGIQNQKSTKGRITSFWDSENYSTQANNKRQEPSKANKWLETADDCYSMEKITYKMMRTKRKVNGKNMGSL